MPGLGGFGAWTELGCVRVWACDRTLLPLLSLLLGSLLTDDTPRRMRGPSQTIERWYFSTTDISPVVVADKSGISKTGKVQTDRLW